jgi:hypothetical protein
MALFLIGVTLATCALAAADSAGGALATGEALAKAAAPSARVVELALDSVVATSTLPHLGLVIDGNFGPADGSRLGGPRMGLVAGRAHARWSPNRCRDPRVAV